MLGKFCNLFDGYKYLLLSFFSVVLFMLVVVYFNDIFTRELNVCDSNSMEIVFDLTNQDRKSLMYNLIDENDGICFVGDSITEGTVNGNHPWYEELISLFEDKKVFNYSVGGYMTTDIISEYEDELVNSNCNLVVINIGTNDVRYLERSGKDYIRNIKNILEFVRDRKIILLSPWKTTDKDKFMKSNKERKIDIFDDYDDELKKLANEKDNVYYIEANSYIKKMFARYGEETFSEDGVHPNSDLGVKLYSYSVMRD